MFEYARSHQKIFTIVLSFLILPSFVFLGAESYSGMSSKDTDIAKVGKDTITGSAFEMALKNQAQRTGLPSELTNSPTFKTNVLNQMIQQQLLRNELQALRLNVSDERLAKELNRFPEIMSLKKPDGTIDADKYRALLQNNGYSVAQFQNIKRSELMGEDLQNAIASNQQGINSRVVSEKLIASYGVEREVQALFFLGEQYTKKMSTEKSELENYYQANPGEFQSTPTVDIEYVVLARDTKLDEKEYLKKADLFANTVFEQADSLQAVADNLKLVIQKEIGLSSAGKQGIPKNHPLNDPKVLFALFQEEMLKSNKNMEAKQLPNGDLVSIRVTQYQASQTQKFDLVKAAIEKKVIAKKAEDTAVTEGTRAAEQFKQDPRSKIAGREFSKAFWISRNKPMDLSGEPFDKVFGADVSQLPQLVTATIPGVGIALYRINQVRAPKDLSPNLQIEQFKQVSELNLQSELGAYFTNMRERSPVKMVKSLQ